MSDTSRIRFNAGDTDGEQLAKLNDLSEEVTGLLDAPGGGGGGTAGTLDFDTDGTLAANSDAMIATQKATKTYVDGKVAGLSWKQAVRAATTAPGTLASSFENGDAIDGVTLATGDRILVKNQVTASDNGIYTVNASGAPSRATDADSGAELVNASVYVSEGTTNADTQWTCTTNATITVGSTSLAWAQLTSGGATASTTEQLTGTDATKNSTPDSVASLWEQGVDVASAGTISFGDGGYFFVTGTTTITDIDFATDKAGRKAWVKFSGALTLTHNSSTLILPRGANIATAAGDTACFVSEGSDVVRCICYQRADGSALAASGLITSSGYTQNTNKILGRTTASAGAIEEIAVGAGLTFAGGALSATSAGGGGGANWTEVGNYDFATGAAATFEANVSGYAEVLVLIGPLVNTSTVVRGVQVSTDGGSTWYTANADYATLAATGAGSSTAFLPAQTSSTTTAEQGVVHFYALNTSYKKFINLPTRGITALFQATTTAINRIRVMGNTSVSVGTPSGSFTSGSVQVLAR